MADGIMSKYEASNRDAYLTAKQVCSKIMASNSLDKQTATEKSQPVNLVVPS